MFDVNPKIQKIKTGSTLLLTILAILFFLVKYWENKKQKKIEHI